MPKIIDYSGMVFGKTFCLGVSGTHITNSGQHLKKVLLQCQCGSEPFEKISRDLKELSNDYSCAECRVSSLTLDLTGKVFKHLTAISILNDVSENKSRMWRCLCDCGKEVIKSAAYLVHGKNPSCGCSKYENVTGNKTHGKSGTKEHKTWLRIINRCTDKNSEDYKDYGGRGIKVCERWLESFENFYQDMGERPADKKSIDRINVNGDYCPENCRWADDFEQAQNKRKSSNNSSGKTGVTFENGRGNKHWVSFIKHNGRSKKKGFEYMIDAIFQRMEWEQESYGFCKQ